MKRIPYLLAVTMLITATSCLGASNIPTMNLSWSTTATNISKFKLYYSSSPDMTNKQWHTECQSAIESPTGTGNYTMTCTNIPIQIFPLYIYVSAVKVDLTEELASNIQKISYSPITPSILTIK